MPAVAAIGARPVEYLLLRAQPVPWLPEDSLLVAYAQWIDLQGIGDVGEQRNGRLAATLPAGVLRFLSEPDPTFEATLDGTRLRGAAVAGAGRVRPAQARPFAVRTRAARAGGPAARGRRARCTGAGSNNLAVAGAAARMAAAWLANDMHLRLRVPNTWYRARLVVGRRRDRRDRRDAARRAARRRRQQRPRRLGIHRTATAISRTSSPSSRYRVDPVITSRPTGRAHSSWTPRLSKLQAGHPRRSSCGARSGVP